MRTAVVTYPQPIRRLARDEYLAFERASDTKHEYVSGEVYAMTGASRAHNLIVTNLVRHLANKLAGRRCEIYANDMRVKVEREGDYVYPDLAVVCGDPALEDEHFDTLLNPTLIVEVLSPTTRDYDRGGKWEKYRRIESLRDYLAVSQERPHVEHYTRQQGRFWLLSELFDFAASLQLDSIGCTLAVGEIYENVPVAGPARADPQPESHHG